MKIIVEIHTETSPNKKRSLFNNFREEVEHYLDVCFDMDCFRNDYCRVEKITWVKDEEYLENK